MPDTYLNEARKWCIASQRGESPHKFPYDSVKCEQCTSIAKAIRYHRASTLRDVARPMYLGSVIVHWNLKKNNNEPTPTLLELLRTKLRDAADRIHNSSEMYELDKG